MDLTPKFQQLKLNKDVETYASDNSGLAQCFCDGRCKVYGRCPNSIETPEQKARRRGVPLIRPKPQPKNENPIVGVCEPCGREIRAYNNMACLNHLCPCDLGPKPC
jgi:hypothetical protein